MPSYCYRCEECGSDMIMLRAMGDAPEEIVCILCRGTMIRYFTAPQLCTNPTRFREENRWWWTKPGQVNSTHDKLLMDRADAKHRAQQEAEWAEKKKISDSS
jgi:hypothetical protein